MESGRSPSTAGWRVSLHLGPNIEKILSPARRQIDPSVREVYEYVWKSQNLAWRLLQTNEGDSTLSSEALAVSRHLREARRHLAQLALAVPTADKQDDVISRLADATNEKEQLERQLARLSVESADYQRVRDASVEQLAALLPSDAAFIDIVYCADYFVEPPERDEQGLGELAVDYRYDAFIIRPTTAEEGYRVSWVPLDKAICIDEAITAWRKAVSGNRDPGSTTLPDQAMLTDTASTIRRLVWDKIEPQLDGCRVVIIAPEGKLSQVAWGALPGSQPDTLLIEEYAIATAAFGQQLYGLLSAPPTIAGKLLVAGGLRYDDSADLKPDSTDLQRSATAGPAGTHGSLVTDNQRTVWPALPGTRVEAEEVVNQFSEHSRLPHLAFFDADASQRNIESVMPQCQYVHLATHGFFAAPGTTGVFHLDPHEQSLFSQSPTNYDTRRSGTLGGRSPLLLSGLVLSGANAEPERDENDVPLGDDGILTAEEVVGLNLRNTELVVLSACETGLGDVAEGEGVFGLQRAFHQAGARTVIASLWKVDDAATRSLMIAFYRNLLEKKMGRLEALRAAQLTLLRGEGDISESQRGLGSSSTPLERKTSTSQRLSPTYWAAFTLSGDWR